VEVLFGYFYFLSEISKILHWRLRMRMGSEILE